MWLSVCVGIEIALSTHPVSAYLLEYVSFFLNQSCMLRWKAGDRHLHQQQGTGLFWAFNIWGRRTRRVCNMRAVSSMVKQEKGFFPPPLSFFKSTRGSGVNNSFPLAQGTSYCHRLTSTRTGGRRASYCLWTAERGKEAERDGARGRGEAW